MLTRIAREGDKEVIVDYDQPAGTMNVVMCRDHGRMADSIEQRAWICTASDPDLAAALRFPDAGPVQIPCGIRFSYKEWEDLRQSGFDAVKREDRETNRREAQIAADRRSRKEY